MLSTPLAPPDHPQDNLVRFSVGVERFEDIWDDVEQALAQI